jgi:hypothetical protein
MSETNMNPTSEWNEQMSYSNLFFQSCINCRNAQLGRNYEMWKYSLEAKIQVALMIVNENDAKTLFDHKQRLCATYSKCISQKKESMGSIQTDFKSFVDDAFMIESDVDRMVNRVMPFLNTKKKVGMEGI